MMRLRVIVPFEARHPATVLETRIGGEVKHTIAVPASTTVYTLGQIVKFARKGEALAFLRAHPDKFEIVKEVKP